MLTIYSTRQAQPEENKDEGTVVHPIEYALLCTDAAGNKMEIYTDKSTYVEVSNFIDALKNV
jgi:catechol-2,3-dioxygenase